MKWWSTAPLFGLLSHSFVRHNSREERKRRTLRKPPE
jgi:hypothetical protein